MRLLLRPFCHLQQQQQMHWPDRKTAREPRPIVIFGGLINIAILISSSETSVRSFRRCMRRSNRQKNSFNLFQVDFSSGDNQWEGGSDLQLPPPFIYLLLGSPPPQRHLQLVPRHLCNGGKRPSDNRPFFEPTIEPVWPEFLILLPLNVFIAFLCAV